MTALEALRDIVDTNRAYWTGKHSDGKAQAFKEAMDRADEFLDKYDKQEQPNLFEEVA